MFFLGILLFTIMIGSAMKTTASKRIVDDGSSGTIG
jgi:hypothetical protein